MSITSTYTSLLTEKILREILAESETPTVAEITNRLDAFLEANDISKPLFSADDYKVSFGEASSRSKYNSMTSLIQQDLKVLFSHLLKVSDQSINQFERWKAEARLLERQLDEIKDRVDSLLLLTQDTEGYFNYVQDNFVDTSKTELLVTNAYVNVDKGLLTLGTSNAGATRIDLSTLTDDNIQFTILSRNNLVSSLSSSGSRLKNIVNDVSNFWQERVLTSAPAPVSAEIKVDLGSETTVSRIDVDLHMSNENSKVQLTPMYSSDDHNFFQLPITNFTRQVSDRTSFQFSAVEARYFKFIMTKTGYDSRNNNGQYFYEFGVDEIAFFNEGFSSSTSATASGSIFLSKPLSVLGNDGNPLTFSKLALETCEDVPTGTSINYSVLVSNLEDAPYSNISFIPIDPLTRANATKTTVLSFGEIGAVSVSGVGVSYNPTESTAVYINPARNFSFIQEVAGSTATVSSGLASAQRYSFQNSSERILSHSIASGINIDQGTLELWRNVAKRGTTTETRGYPCGWGFETPWYTTTIYVDNADGASIDFGGQTVVIDEEAKKGRVSISYGAHKVKVHRDNWKEITTVGASSLSALKAADSLYPYNHRYLVEGYSYATNYPTTEEKIYRGFDIVAEHKMRQVSPFELSNSVPDDDFGKFALDLDAEDTSRLINGIPSTSEVQMAGNNVILLKVDESNPDFVNEDFLIKFKSSDVRYKYLRLKAVLKTTDTSIAPSIDSYRIKIAG